MIQKGQPVLHMIKILYFVFLSLSMMYAANPAALAQPQKKSSSNDVLIGTLDNGIKVWATKNDAGWGMVVKEAQMASLVQSKPIELEWYQDSLTIQSHQFAYQSVRKNANGLLASAKIQLKGITFDVQDSWSNTGKVLNVSRKMMVSGSGKGGFLSAITFTTVSDQSRDEVNYFAPGMIYGGTDHLTKVAIGGEQGGTTIRIREDRLPAPLFGLHFKDGSSVTMMDAAPKATTTTEDSHDVQAKTLIDEKFQFASLGAEEKGGKTRFGFWWPGTEGEVTYQGNTYPGGQMRKWRRRYHPVKNGLIQQYQVAFRFARQEQFPAYYTNAWRWAWNMLKPAVTYHDIEQVRRSLIDMMGERTMTAPDGRTGIPMFVNSATKEIPERHFDAVMGFVGKNLEAAEFMLKDADRDKSPNGEKHRKLALALFDSFVKMKMNPPVSEGFNLKTGKDNSNFSDRVFLRSLTDDFKATMRTIRYEKKQGREHPEWLNWCISFADWLLTQQAADGGFPRSWKPVTGEVLDPSGQSSYNVIPFFVLLSQHTGDQKYLSAALKAAEYCWNNVQSKGVFVGGTIDNPDVIDKEAGTLSVEAYLALYQATQDRKWIDRAIPAANFAETWMYIWNIPMPTDENNAKLHWKQGVQTVGLQLISSGHSLVDAYMTFDVDEYAKLFKYTDDPHYYEVARILLHNTKSMLALPGRTYDLVGTGWQQEHWSLAPRRGYGLHRGWLPWVSTSHLNGIFGLEEFDSELFKKLSKEGDLK